MTAPLPGPDQSAEQTEYLRRAAEAAEATRRNSRILVIALVVFPVAIVVGVLAIWAVNAASTSIAAAKERAGIAAVEEAARSVGYTPPAYTTIRNQVSGICQNLSTGMSTTEAAAKFAVGFAGGMPIGDAIVIVDAADREVC